jgi:uncharacterized membrane protein YbhN (UPF0104 family)
MEKLAALQRKSPAKLWRLEGANYLANFFSNNTPMSGCLLSVKKALMKYTNLAG